MARFDAMDSELSVSGVTTRDALEEATEILEEPSKHVKRKILISVNVIIVLVLVLHISVQLATVGHLPDPARDNVVLPLIVLVNPASAIYNLRALADEQRSSDRL